jgi:hypothetical protein
VLLLVVVVAVVVVVVVLLAMVRRLSHLRNLLNWHLLYVLIVVARRFCNNRVFFRIR